MNWPTDKKTAKNERESTEEQSNWQKQVTLQKRDAQMIWQTDKNAAHYRRKMQRHSNRRTKSQQTQHTSKERSPDKITNWRKDGTQRKRNAQKNRKIDGKEGTLTDWLNDKPKRKRDAQMKQNTDKKMADYARGVHRGTKRLMERQYTTRERCTNEMKERQERTAHFKRDMRRRTDRLTKIQHTTKERSTDELEHATKEIMQR